MKPRLHSLAALLCLAALPLLAQGRGSGGMQGGQGRQGMPGMQRGQNQGGQIGQQDRQRMRIHATQDQRTQYRNCKQSMQRVRSRIREMARLTKNQAINRQQLQQIHEQLRSELQSMQQQQETLRSGFDEEQKAAVQELTLQMNHSQMDLDSFSEALAFERNQVDANPDRVREQVRKMDRTSKKLEQQQREMGADAGLD